MKFLDELAHEFVETKIADDVKLIAMANLSVYSPEVMAKVYAGAADIVEQRRYWSPIKRMFQKAIVKEMRRKSTEYLNIPNN